MAIEVGMSDGNVVASELRGRLRQALDDLRSELEEDDVYPSPETQEAFIGQLAEASKRFAAHEEFPFPSLSAAPDGGIRCEWNWGKKALVATFQPTGSGRLHRIDRTTQEPIYTHMNLPNMLELADSLHWIAGNARPRRQPGV